MEIQVLASGSKGNATYLKTRNLQILIDAGISPRQIKLRGAYDLAATDYLIITHDHSDHAKFIETVLKASGATLIINEQTLAALPERTKRFLAGKKLHLVEAEIMLRLGELKIFPLQMIHDAANCFGYVFVEGGKSCGYMTDTGVIKQAYIPLLQRVDTLLIEANHDIDMLMNSARPWALKQRILSVYGHLSNLATSKVVSEVAKAGRLAHLVLLHLSEECNTPELAREAMTEAGITVPVTIARQHEPLAPFTVGAADV